MHFNATQAALRSAPILFLFLVLMLFNAENKASHTYVDENIVRMAFARVFRAPKFSGIEFHTLRISQSGFLLAMPVERSRSRSSK